MSENPNRQITVFFIAVLLIFLFFTAFAFLFLGGNRQPLLLPGSTLTDDEDVAYDTNTGTAAGSTQTYKNNYSSGMPSVNRGRYIPQTLAEKAYFSAETKIRTMKKRSAAKRKRQTAVTEFFKSPLGQNLKATFELAKRGQTASAKKFLNRILEDIVDMDPLIQQYVLQSAMSIYAHDNDKKGLGQMLSRYLEFANENKIGEDNARMNLIADVRRKVGELQN